MKKYFIAARNNISLPDIPNDEIVSFKKDTLEEMIRMGASENDCRLVSENVIINAIMKKMNPGDVAWAILQ